MLTVCPAQCSQLPDALSFGFRCMESDDPEPISGLPLPGHEVLRPVR